MTGCWVRGVDPTTRSRCFRGSPGVARWLSALPLSMALPAEMAESTDPAVGQYDV